MEQIEHIGIAVKNLEESIKVYEKLLGTSCYKKEIVESEHVITAFFLQGQNKIELLQSLQPDGVIAKFIEKKGEGIHHIAYRSNDILQDMQRLTQDGFVLLNSQPKAGADNMMICFVHPKNTCGVLTELCMDKDLYLEKYQ